MDVGRFGHCCLGSSSVSLVALQILLELFDLRLRLFDVCGHLRHFGFCLRNALCQCPVAILAVTHELIKEFLFFLTFCSDLCLHRLQHCHNFADRICRHCCLLLGVCGICQRKRCEANQFECHDSLSCRMLLRCGLEAAIRRANLHLALLRHEVVAENA